MGIRGLMSSCTKNACDCSDVVDLVKVAKDRGGIEILVDYASFVFIIRKVCMKKHSSATKNPNVTLMGSEFKVVDEYLTKLVEDLKSMHIHLVMIKDGSKGSCPIVAKQKIATWKERAMSNRQKVDRGMSNLHCPEEEDIFLPDNFSLQLLCTLRRCGCDMIAAPAGEADYIIARNLRERPKAFAVLGNDSDFLIFPNCPFIPQEFFDVQDDLGFKKQQTLPSKPSKLVCRLMSSSKIFRFLQLRKESDLVEMSILCGNDYTSPHIDRLKEKLGINGRGPRGGINIFIAQVCKWLRNNSIDTSPIVQAELALKPELREAIEKSRAFYDVSIPFESRYGEAVQNAQMKALVDGVKGLQLPSKVIGIYHQFFWRDISPEKLGPGKKPVSLALRGLRQQFYPLITSSEVTEYGTLPGGDFEIFKVEPAATDVPTYSQLRFKEETSQNMKIFYQIMTHMEKNPNLNLQPNYEKSDRWGDDFRNLVLRYFLLLNKKQHLEIDSDELDTAVAMVFRLQVSSVTIDDTWYMKQVLCPTARCFTVFSWLQAIYHHAYAYIGQLLHLDDKFPGPKDVISGAVWTALYMAAKDPGRTKTLIGATNFSRVCQDRERILAEKKSVINEIVKDTN